MAYNSFDPPSSKQGTSRAVASPVAVRTGSRSKKIALWFAGSLVGFFALLFILAALFKEQIGKRVLQEVNKELKTELKIGSFDLSLIRDFPNAAVYLNTISLKDLSGGTLLKAEKLSFRFGLFSIFGSNINIKKVVIENGALNIKYDSRGLANFDIFKGTSTKKKSDSDIVFMLEEALLKNIELSYQDLPATQNCSMHIENALFSGEFSDKKFTLESEAELTSHFVDMAGTRYLPEKKWSYTAAIQVDRTQNLYQFDKVTMTLEGNTLNLGGKVIATDAYTNFDLNLGSKECDLSSVLALLPPAYQSYFSDFKSSGTFTLSGGVKGKKGGAENPSIRLDAVLKNGEIQSQKLSNVLENVNFKASLSNEPSHSNKDMVFEITNFKGNFDKKPLDFRLKVENFDDPLLNFAINGTLPLASVYGLLNDPNITNGDGEIIVNHLSASGRYADMQTKATMQNVQVAGEVNFNNASLTIRKEAIIFKTGTFKLNNNNLDMSKIRIEGAGCNALIEGSFFNFIPVLLSDSLSYGKTPLEFKATLFASELDADRLMALTTVSEKEVAAQQKEAVNTGKKRGVLHDTPTTAAEATNEHRQNIMEILDGVFEAQIEHLNYDKIDGENFDGEILFNQNELIITGDVETMGGKINLQSVLYATDKPHIKAILNCEKINSTTFFRQCNNFGQRILQDKNIAGTLNTKMAINAFWDKNNTFLMDKLHVLSWLEVQNGTLKDVEMLKGFSTYVKLADLEQIKFTNMENWFEVKNRKIYIPVIDLRSNALNMTFSGEHSFNQDINYNIKVNGAQVLINRFKKHDSSLEPQADVASGLFNLYFNMAGNLDKDYKVKPAKKLVKAEFEHSQIYKKQIQTALDNAFHGEFRPINNGEIKTTNTDEFLFQ
jgi:AsmA-like C-terminal region